MSETSPDLPRARLLWSLSTRVVLLLCCIGKSLNIIYSETFIEHLLHARTVPSAGEDIKK